MRSVRWKGYVEEMGFIKRGVDPSDWYNESRICRRVCDVWLTERHSISCGINRVINKTLPVATDRCSNISSANHGLYATFSNNAGLRSPTRNMFIHSLIYLFISFVIKVI